jgi:phosphohistidine swiveling domain-containing protein
MPTRLYRSGDSTDLRILGGKAATLGMLANEGVAIPPWFVVSGGADGELDALAPDLDRALRDLSPDGRPVAVRSSAVDEDGQENSFAGQLESFLNVLPADLAARIKDVRASGRSQRVRDYRRSRGLSGEPPVPAVLIQRMVRSEWAGVAFSVDPVTHDRSVAVVAAVSGLGESLVSGERDADTFRVDPSGRILSVEKAPSGAASGLPEEMVPQIAAMVRRVSERRGSPQDIEWAVEDGRVYLLQARPITTLGVSPATVAPSGSSPGRLVIWDNSNIAESYGGITQPLTFSFARAAYEEVYRSFCRIMGVPPAVINDSDEVYSNMLGLIRGRVYYNLLNWYRLLAMLPGYAVNRRFMEQMMGVSASLSDELAETLKRPQHVSRFMAMVRLGASLASLELQRRRLPRMIRDFYSRLNSSLGTDAKRLRTMRPDELAAYYRELQNRLLRRWDAPIVNDFLAMLFHGLLRSLSSRWIDATSESLHNDLVRGVGGVVSIEPAARLRQMAEAIKDDPGLARVLQTAKLPDMLAAVEAHPSLKTLYQEYLDKFADRCLEELKLESSTLADDPTTLLRCVGHMASRLAMGSMSDSGDAAAAARALKLVRDRLRWRPIRRMIFAWVSRNARERVRDRENLRFERTRVFGRVRRVFVEIGQRLAAQDLLKSPRDVFYLEVEEVLGFIEGTATTIDLKSLVALRTRQYEQFAAEQPPPDRFSTLGMVNPLDANERAREIVAADPHSRRGTGCCAGKVRGFVRIIRDPRGAELRSGEILVAERTDPGWVMLFPAAAGILVERGSLLSHSAIVSRELGIPGIVSIPGLTSWLRDGDEVDFDGSLGIVRLIARAGANGGPA